MLLPLMGLHYMRLVKGTQNERGYSGDTQRLMLSLDLTGQSGAEHAKNLEKMLDRQDALLLLKEFSPARVKAIGAMLLQGRSENEKTELIRKYPQIFHGDTTLTSPAKKKS
jgi:hypothetical protein